MIIFFFLDRVRKGLPCGVVKEFFRTSKNFSYTVKKNYRQNVRLSSSDFFSLESQVILPLFSIKFSQVISWLLYNWIYSLPHSRLRNSTLRIFPLTVLGSSSTKSIYMKSKLIDLTYCYINQTQYNYFFFNSHENMKMIKDL